MVVESNWHDNSIKRRCNLQRDNRKIASSFDSGRRFYVEYHWCYFEASKIDGYDFLESELFR